MTSYCPYDDGACLFIDKCCKHCPYNNEEVEVKKNETR